MKTGKRKLLKTLGAIQKGVGAMREVTDMDIEKLSDSFPNRHAALLKKCDVLERQIARLTRERALGERIHAAIDAGISCVENGGQLPPKLKRTINRVTSRWSKGLDASVSDEDCVALLALNRRKTPAPENKLRAPAPQNKRLV